MKAKIYRVLRFAMIVLYFLALVVPTIHRFFPFYEEIPLIGIRKAEKTAPKFSLGDWFSGKYAADTDKWIKDHHGFATDLVRLHRWGLYKLTGQVVHAPATNTDTLIGKDGFLYENLYVADAVRKPGMSENDISIFASKLKYVRDLLNKKNTAFVVILAPNKALICPENLPSWARGLSDIKNSDYYLFKEALKERDIPFFDTNQYFKENWNTEKQLQAPHSAHWSYYGAWMVVTNTIPIINSQRVLDISLPVPRFADSMKLAAIGMDDELRPQLNLPKFCNDYSERAIVEYPLGDISFDTVFSHYREISGKKLKALIIGDSYGFGVGDALRRQPLFDEIVYWYYCRTIYTVSGIENYFKKEWSYAKFSSLGIFEKEYAYEKYCQDSDVVIYVMTTFNIDKLGWGFPNIMMNAHRNEQ